MKDAGLSRPAPMLAVEVRRLAGTSGSLVRVIANDIAKRNAEQMRHDGGRHSPALNLAIVKRQLDATAPEYRQ
jgi:hypothetical protein